MNKIQEESVAFAALRMQPITNGHHRLISQMLRDNDVVIIGLGSVQLAGVMNNPFTAKERTEMLRMLFGKNSKIKIIPLNDIGATEREEWVSHCMDLIKGKNLPTPTKYYAGSTTDLDWFFDAVNSDGNKIELINMERHQTGIMSGSEVRQSFSTGSKEWITHVPGCLVNYIHSNFPQELTLEFHRNLKRIKNQNK